MRNLRALSVLAALAAAAVAGQRLASAADQFPPGEIEHFEKHVRPILVERCQKCHDPEQQKGGLRLDSRAAALAGGDSGPAVVPGKPDEGYLVSAIQHGEAFQMPPSGKLAAHQIEAIVRWVERGAAWPETATVVGGKPAEALDLAARAKHWSWQPVVRPAPPPVRDAAFVRTPIDAFILARLEAADCQPADEADPLALFRRLSFDLTGLPPAPAEIEQFVADRAPGAYERAVERLLASPHYGERWARHWLDLVRYGESRGHEFDYDIPNAWQYRDYLIRAWNADVPYDQMVLEHLAGDLLDAPRRHPTRGGNESILATGWAWLGEEVHSPVDLRQDECDRNDNRLDVLGKTFLGLTIACARCHDHKFDAISQRDYYGLAGFFVSTSYRQVAFETDLANRRVAAALAEQDAAAGGPLRRAVAEAVQPLLAALPAYAAAAGARLRADPPAAAAEAAAPADTAAGLETAAEAEAAGAPRSAAAPGPPPDLDPALVAAWAEYLRGPAEPDDAVHALWTDLAAGRDPLPHDVSPPAPPDANRPGPRTIADYGGPGRTAWIVDGEAYGPRPFRPGEVCCGTSIERPLDRVLPWGGARLDPAWLDLQRAPGTQLDPGRYANPRRAGRMLRTEKFTLASGRLWYLVAGSGEAYAAVQSHVMNHGPLHAALVRPWTGSRRFRWVEHDLRAYAGRRVAIEFAPYGRDWKEAVEKAPPNDPPVDELIVVRVVESAEPPPAEELNADWLRAELDARRKARGDTRDGRARLTAALGDAMRRLAGEGLLSDRPTVEIVLADWLVRHPRLWQRPGAAETRALAARVAPLLAARQQLVDRIERCSAAGPAMLDGDGLDETLLVRGNVRTPREPVPRHLLEVLDGSQPVAGPGSGRLELARRLVDGRNPLVARVIVNRLWHHLLGRGIVPSTDDFGVMGQPPTHPELLDWLAAELVQPTALPGEPRPAPWSLKHVVRLIVRSSVYRLAHRPRPASLAADPENKLWHYRPARRLEAEAIRDAVLAVSGRLDRRLEGPSVPVYLTEFMSGRGRPAASGPLDGDGRRSIYLAVRRNFLTPWFLAFDFPIPSTTIGRRTVSHLPAQALALMNNPFIAAEMERWGQRIAADSAAPPAARIRAMFLAALGRPPRDDEAAAAQEFLAAQAAERHTTADDPRVWSDLGHALVNASEFVFVH